MRYGSRHRGARVRWVVGLLLVCAGWANGNQGLDAVIERAGNADDDLVRLRLLTELRDRSQLSASVKEDLDSLITQIDRWIRSKSLAYFGSEVSRKLDYDFGVAESSPLYPLTYLYRGRMVIWYALESGGVWNIPDRKRAFMEKGRRFFEVYKQAFPTNRIVRMYLGEPITSTKEYPAVSGAPAWAVHQREGLERLADIIEWWIDSRMQDDGQYGGGWGDDCEMWRWWAPVLIGLDDPKIGAAQARFSSALLAQPHMKDGYTSRMSDVEHTAEDSADVITPMMHLEADNPAWSRRALRLAELTEGLWTGRNERGFLQFKSTYFTAEKLDANPQRACDTVYHPRAVQPTLLYWQRTGDAKLTRLFSDWMDTWVDAAARAERGKPAGIIPTAIHWPDGRVGGLGPDWWDPRNHGEYTLYLFPSAMGLMTHTLLQTYHMTGQEKYLAPIRSMARARLEYLESPPVQLKPGSRAWCASRLGGLESVVAKYRFLTGRTEFDRFLRKGASPYMRLRLEGDRRPLEQALAANAEALRINWPGYTSEVRYTDRVLRFPTLFGENGIMGTAISGIDSPNPSALYSSATGDPGSVDYLPLNAVRWRTPPRDIAALVTDSGSDRFVAELFHFGPEPRPIRADLFLLTPSPDRPYRMTLRTASNDRKVLISKELTVSRRGMQISFELPSRRLCVLDIR